jgi:tetratricopeptide (TPR) repeat protein
LAAAERAVARAPDYGEPWRLLEEWRAGRGERDQNLALARHIATQRAGDPAPRARLARLLSENDRHAEALAEIDAALVLAPTQADWHDLRATLLTLAGRYEEALAACAPAALGAEPPLALRGRAAWVEWMRGNRHGAIERMRALVAARPDYAFGWERLAEWLEQQGEIARATEAAEKLVQLAPDAPYPLGYVADLKIRAGNKRGAAIDLQRALRINPAYVFAAFTLLRLACEERELPEAEQALAHLRRHVSPWQALRFEIMVHRAKGDQAAAQRALRELARAPEHEAEAIHAAAQVFLDAGWLHALHTALAEMLPLPDVHPAAGTWWMRARLRAGAGPRLRWLEQTTHHAAVRERAWCVYLEWLGDQRHAWRLRWHLWRRGTWLHARDGTWGSAGYALHSVDHARRLAAWMADWEQRAGAEPWMLNNLGHSLLSLGRDADVLRICAHVLRRPADHTRPMFVAWGALLGALGGDLAAAGRLLATFDFKTQLVFAQIAATQARAIVTVAGASEESRATALAAESARLKQLAAEHAGAFAHAHVRRLQRAALRTMARMAGRPWLERWYALPLWRFNHASQTTAAVAVGLLTLLALGTIASRQGGDGFAGPFFVLAAIGIAARWIRRR